MCSNFNYLTIADSRKKRLMDIILEERFGDLDKDYEACLELLAISEKDYDMFGISFAHAYIGDCFIGKNNSVDAFIHLIKARELCEKNRYLDLLSNVCSWIGLYYEMQDDRQVAARYYLDALELTKITGDVERKSILFGNVATVFERCGNYVMAHEYYLASLNCYDAPDNLSSPPSHYAPIIANIISVCCYLGKLDEAQHYISILELNFSEKACELYSSKLILSSVRGDLETAYESAENFIREVEKSRLDRFRLFEMLLDVALNMQSLDKPCYVKKVLEMVGGLCNENEYGRRLQLQYVWMHVHEKFGSAEEKNASYHEFYKLRKINDSIVNKALVEGILSDIKLREAIRENEKITEMKELWENKAQIDGLTQLLNRHSFSSTIEHIRTTDDAHTLSFIMIDIDYFKQYNDTYGHGKGDDALRAVAECITKASDEGIYNFRYGGDEFVTMCKNKTFDEVESFIKALTEMLCCKSIPHITSLCSNQVTLSIGFSLSTSEEKGSIDVTKLMEQADHALYAAKEKGRNCCCIYDKL